MHVSKKALILVLLPIFLAFLVSFASQSTIMSNQTRYTQWLASYGSSFILVYIIVQVITIIVAPLGGFFIQVGLFALLEPFQAVLLIYAVTTPAYFINFFLARRFGRPLVMRLIGKGAMEYVDTQGKEIGPSLLLIAKIFQAGIFDYVSYAAGLTKIRFEVFFLINVFGGLPGILISYLILTYLHNFTLSIMTLLFSGYIMFGVALVLLHWQRHRNERLQEGYGKQ